VAGDPASVFGAAGRIALSQSEARRLFGDAPAVGRTLRLVSYGETQDFVVAGVYADWPDASHMRPTAILRLEPDVMAQRNWIRDDWLVFSQRAYIKLKPGSTIADIQSRLAAFKQSRMPAIPIGGSWISVSTIIDLGFVKLTAIHVDGARMKAIRAGGDRVTMAMFTVLAVLVLAVACINFMNLATARASQRGREVALRKVLGADRIRLVAQFLGESLLIAGLAVVLALAIAELLLPTVSRMLGTQLSIQALRDPGLLGAALVLAGIVGAIGGAYPALYLSGLRPARILKANHSLEIEGASKLRQVLVVVQFAVAIVLIICTMVVTAQTWHARTADPGFNSENLLLIKNLNRKQLEPLRPRLRELIAQTPGVERTAFTSLAFASQPHSNVAVYLQPGQRNPPTMFEAIDVDHGALATMGVTQLAGRDFDPANPADRADGLCQLKIGPAAVGPRTLNHVMINDAAARSLGWTPDQAVGRTLYVAGGENREDLRPIKVIGVVVNTQPRSIRDAILPAYFAPCDGTYHQMLVRIAGNPREVIPAIEQRWREVAPLVPFEFEFVDQALDRQYDADTARAGLFAAFAALAIGVACLGLYGLAAFATERRTKEIGIRKVMGAQVSDILGLLMWQLAKPVLVANLIAWPLAWALMQGWLDQFTDRIALNPLWFVVAGSAALLLAWITVAAHALRIARESPIHALRYE
jgi:putative ABC transport system permease protein